MGHETLKRYNYTSLASLRLVWTQKNVPRNRSLVIKSVWCMQTRITYDIISLMKSSYGRPFFVCSDKFKPCSFWVRGLCTINGVTRVPSWIPCVICNFKKEGLNRDRLFFCCACYLVPCRLLIPIIYRIVNIDGPAIDSKLLFSSSALRLHNLYVQLFDFVFCNALSSTV